MKCFGEHISLFMNFRNSLCYGLYNPFAVRHTYLCGYRFRTANVDGKISIVHFSVLFFFLFGLIVVEMTVDKNRLNHTIFIHTKVSLFSWELPNGLFVINFTRKMFTSHSVFPLSNCAHNYLKWMAKKSRFNQMRQTARNKSKNGDQRKAWSFHINITTCNRNYGKKLKKKEEATTHSEKARRKSDH